MKNISKTIAALSLSMLTIGAMAQAPMRPTLSNKVLVKTGSRAPGAHSTHAPSIGINNGIIDYVDGDANNQGLAFGTTYTLWGPSLWMNAGYTLADTVFSPLSSGRANVHLANSVTVVYDTLWDNDAFQQTGNGFVRPHGGTVTIDTIWTILNYKNKSNKNDTLILTVSGVTAGGYPSMATIYEVDTEIIAPHTAGLLPGTSLDSNFEVGFIPKAAGGALTIPNSAHGGWHFGVTATVTKGSSKLDTLGITYYSNINQTCAVGNLTDTMTSMGAKNGTTISGAPQYNNSFITGEYWYMAPHPYGGPGGSTTFPGTSGAGQGRWSNGTDGFYYFDPGSCGFTWYPYVQNIGILVSVNYTLLGVDNVNNDNGLAVAQNYPNPFNKATTINYSLTKSSDVTFTVYDVTGRVITTTNYGNVAPGQYQVNLSANTFSPGIYFYTFNVNGSVVTKKMVITQ